MSPPHLSGYELKFVEQAFDSNWIAPVGPAIDEFEKQISQYNLVDQCLVVNSGTSAIHLALIILGVERGDEVICPTFTFSGSCNPIVYQSATPVFVDSEMESWNMDPVLLEQAIENRIRLGKKPKAIIVVHLFGMPAKMNEIMRVALQYEIPVIEDAAEALGSTYHEKKVGTIGDIGIYSFNGNKIVTTSGGGAIVSPNKQWIDHARFLSSQARSAAPYYQHEAIGYNYQLSNVCASIGLGQLKVLNQRVNQRRMVFGTYKELLDNSIFSFQPEIIGAKSNRWLTTVLIEPDRGVDLNEKIRIGLEMENIETRPLWKPMHMQPVFKDAPAFLNGVSESLFKKGLCLPSGSGLTLKEITLITDEINKVLIC